MNAPTRIDWGAHTPPRAGDGALALANFDRTAAKDCFGEGAETRTRDACATQTNNQRSPTYE
jgi:hypothetical protein